MTAHEVVDIVQNALLSAFWLSLPLMIIGFVAGVLTSLLQIVTSIQDPAVGSVPRLAAFLVGLLLLLPWMIMRMTSYASGILGNLGHYAR